MPRFDYDLVVLGGGSGGISSAFLAQSLGKSVALVEKARVGGDCVWYGCVPSKTLIRAARALHEAESLARFGVSARLADVSKDGVMRHVRAVRESVHEEEKVKFSEREITVIHGEPRFVDAHTIEVGDRTIRARRFVIATGSTPFVPPVDGLAAAAHLTNEKLFELESLPGSLAVLGGGPIGTEMAAAMNRLGVRVTVLQRGPRILPRDDVELVDMLTDRLREEGVVIQTGCEVVRVEGEEGGVTLTVRGEDGSTETLQSETLLVAVGQRPNVSGMDLENAGVDYSAKGIRTDTTLRTTARNIYAVGDVVGGYQFSHIAEYHATIAVTNALLPLPVKRKTDYSNIVWATFTDPELAHAGLTEDEARDRYGDSVRVYRFDFRNADRARTDGAEFGRAKYVCDPRGRLLGIHILGEHASDLLHEAQLAKSLGVKFSKIADMVHIYPTYGDVVKRPAGQSYADDLRRNPIIRMFMKS
jgi:pyruvate/2-oxoglutarate dehydrogenase complex dihydrolipoamide dehydrogenase (E3) component